MYFLIYSSLASPDTTETDMKAILEASERNNKADGITGMLIFHNGSFIQMLEGENDKVLASYHKIQDDPRHTAVIKLFEGETDKRHFPNWKMALEVVHPEEFKKIQAYESTEKGKQFLSEVNDDHIGLQMLRFFYEQKHS